MEIIFDEKYSQKTRKNTQRVCHKKFINNIYAETVKSMF